MSRQPVVVWNIRLVAYYGLHDHSKKDRTGLVHSCSICSNYSYVQEHNSRRDAREKLYHFPLLDMEEWAQILLDMRPDCSLYRFNPPHFILDSIEE